MSSLSEQSVGHFYEVVELQGTGELKRRLLELGFHAGCRIWLAARLPFGGPLIVRVHTLSMALRDVEARCLIVR
jgi:ferrous iron transport protein A